MEKAGRGRKKSRWRHELVVPFADTGRLRTEMPVWVGRSFSWGN